MSVLIKGMKMPEDCFLCPCIEYEHPGYVCWITGYQAHHNERPIGCPLIEVPPHGRLIDAKALTKDLGNRWNVNDDQDFCNKEVWHGIEEAPTIIEAEDGE